jgi:uncharacterized protein with FMN-binding domain
MAQGGSNRKISGSLVTASGAAVMAVYLAGYIRTETAAARFARQVAESRVAGVASRRVASVRDGLAAKTTAIPEGVLSAPDHPGGETPAAIRHAWKDGTYTGWGFSPHGNIEAAVIIAGGRIASAIISQCRTRYSCAVIDMLPPQVARRQSPDVDYVSGATQSADAFYEAVVAALSKAR